MRGMIAPPQGQQLFRLVHAACGVKQSTNTGPVLAFINQPKRDDDSKKSHHGLAAWGSPVSHQVAISAAFLHAFAMSRISPRGSLRRCDHGISCGLRLIADRNKFNFRSAILDSGAFMGTRSPFGRVDARLQ
jgi:hypothetical protein